MSYFNHRAVWALGLGSLVVSLCACGADGGESGSPAVDLGDVGSTDGAAADGLASDAGNADAAGQDTAGSDTSGVDTSGSDTSGADAQTPLARPFVAHKLEIAGLWESAFGGNERFSDTAYTTAFGASTVIKFDNTKRWLITQNAADSKNNPSKFNKIVWIAPKATDLGGFNVSTTYYCWVAFAQDTAALAEASTQTADGSDPEKTGCGGFSWTKLTSLATVGEWQTPFGTETINRQAWGFSWLRAFENAKNTAYTQNPTDAKYGPDTYNKVVWTAPKDGKWFGCIVDFGQATLDAAKKSTKTADSSDPAKSGCGGFAWTEMTVKK